MPNTEAPVIAKWDIFEAAFEGPSDGNPFIDVDFGATFEHDKRPVTVSGFYDGGGTYRVRFMPDSEGEWTYLTRSNVPALSDRSGTFRCGAPRTGRHGPVAVRNQFHFAHADGTPFFPFGTTCYAWTHQPLAMQAETLATLADTRFNKIRMGVFPKHYIYNENEPLYRAFETATNGGEDCDHFNVEMFRHFDKQVRALRDLGIEADVILFHPYDRWGYCTLSEEQDFRYLRYVVARLAAYSNVWWSLANEYDFLLDVKPIARWDRFFGIIGEVDPYGHPRSIHNGDVAMNYDHRQPWVSHVCIQNWDVKRTAEWREEWGKPLVNDELEYEGDIPRPWGNISALELVHRFWVTVMRGGYAGHGETYMHPDDLLWWAKGGVLRGEAWKRIGFLRDLIEEDVREGLTPFTIKDRWEFNRVSGAHEGQLRYLYFGEHQPREWAVGLPAEDGDYEIDLIDTWEMTVTPLAKGPLPASPALRQRQGAITGGAPEAAFGVRLPGKPFQAVRVRPPKVAPPCRAMAPAPKFAGQSRDERARGMMSDDSGPMTERPPISATYRRFLFDMHVPDWDPSFLSKFDPGRLAAAVKRAGGATITLFANTHTGLNNWPSAVGRMHKAHGGRDVYGEMVDSAHAAGLNVNLYYCLLYVDWYWDNHPESRIVDVLGESRKVMIHSTGHPRRFSTVCPNDPGYRAFALAQVTELAERYVFEGVNLDMTFWPGVCYCASCRKRFDAEVGGAIPEVVDWTSGRWLAFAARRRAWMVELVREVTGTIAERRPSALIAHQSNGYVNDWQFGMSDEQARLSAWLTADLYRDKRDLSFSFKLFNAASERRPFELISGWIWPNIFEHSVLRTAAELEETAVLPIANDAAIMFIDQVDPIGTIAEEHYDRVSPIFRRIAELEPVLGGELMQDVGIYVSFDASFDRRQNGQRVAELGYSTEPMNPKSGPSAHRPAAIAAGETLTRRHIPFGVVTRKHLGRLSDWQVIVLPNVALLSDGETEAFRDYVHAGGRLYASGATSLIAPDGRSDELRLGEVLGVGWLGETAEVLTYMAPLGSERLGTFTRARPLTIHERQARVRITGADAVVRATVTLPYTDPTDARYASLLTDPPGRATTDPAIVENVYGRGRTIYAAAPLEAEPHETQRDVFAALISGLAARPFAFEVEAPPCVEVTMFRQLDRSRLVVHLINVQADTPPVPVHGIRLLIRAGLSTVTGVVSEPDLTQMPWQVLDEGVSIDVPVVNAHRVIRIDLDKPSS